jgi:hypothetical protein
MRRQRVYALVVLLLISMAFSSPLMAATPAAAGEPVVIEGTLLLSVEDDFATGRTTTHYFLHQKGPSRRQDVRHSLTLIPEQAATVHPGMRVRITGRLSGNALTADHGVGALVVLEDTAASGPVEARKVLVLLVDITDAANVTHAVSATCDDSTATVAGLLFGANTTAANANGCYQDSSFDTLGLGGALYPGTAFDVQRVTITDTVTTCDYTSWGEQADAAAANLGSYQHRLYVLPADTSCNWAGVAYVNSCPGPFCQAWVRAYAAQPCGYVDAMAHELGHNLGLMHASWDTDNNGSNDCEYCDDADFMGYAEANLRTLNGPHKVQMGWVSGAGIVDASAGGRFTLSPLNLLNAPLPQVATITPVSGSPYYLSYRVASGYDAFLVNTFYSPGVVGELSIHRWAGGISNTFFITSLRDGQSFTDAASGVTIVQTSHSGAGVTFTVNCPVGHHGRGAKSHCGVPKTRKR